MYSIRHERGEVEWQVYQLTKDHSKWILVRTCESKEEAKDWINIQLGGV